MLDDKEFRELVAKLVSDSDTNLELNPDCVKVWRIIDNLPIQVVLMGCRHVKSIGFNTVVYNTIVPFKKEISEREGINILDGNDLILFCFRDEELLRYERIIKYTY